MRYITLIVHESKLFEELHEGPDRTPGCGRISVPYDPNTLYHASLALGLGVPADIWNGIHRWAQGILKGETDATRT